MVVNTGDIRSLERILRIVEQIGVAAKVVTRISRKARQNGIARVGAINVAAGVAIQAQQVWRPRRHHDVLHVAAATVVSARLFKSETNLRYKPGRNLLFGDVASSRSRKA